MCLVSLIVKLGLSHSGKPFDRSNLSIELWTRNVMSQPYDDSTQKDWKERKGKIENYYREMGQVGTPNNEKVSSIIITKSGDKLVVQFSDGDGILYEIIEDLVSPLRMIKTLSHAEIEKFKKLTK